jgi:hypothetical protein
VTFTTSVGVGEKGETFFTGGAGGIGAGRAVALVRFMGGVCGTAGRNVTFSGGLATGSAGVAGLKVGALGAGVVLATAGLLGKGEKAGAGLDAGGGGETGVFCGQDLYWVFAAEAAWVGADAGGVKVGMGSL